jgi:hypothetical protein
MPNTFNAVPEAAHERSAAFLEVDDPGQRLEDIMEQAQLHRGSLREQDGYTIPFREGGQVRITVHPQGDADRGPGLAFRVSAPTTERRDYIETVITQQARPEADGGVDLHWERSSSN